MFLWVSYPFEWLFFTLVRQTYRNPPPLPGLGTGYVEMTRESLPVNRDADVTVVLRAHKEG